MKRVELKQLRENDLMIENKKLEEQQKQQRKIHAHELNRIQMKLLCTYET